MKNYVLLIEDDPIVQNAYEIKLKKCGIKIQMLNDGREAIAFINNKENELPSLVVLDLMLPHISGFEILATIKKTNNWEKVPVIILSNLSQESDLEKAKRMGANEYLVKADNRIDDVVKKIAQYLKCEV